MLRHPEQRTVMFKNHLSNIRLHFLFLTVVVFVVYGNTFHNGFVWDDLLYITGNSAYLDFDLKRIFFSLANGVEYLPVRDLSYAIDFALWGRNPAGFHITNVTLYAATVIVVYILTRQLCRELHRDEQAVDASSNSIPLVAALLFAVHPLHSEVASFITCRNAIISTLFCLLSCYCYLRTAGCERPKFAGYYVLSLLCFILSLFAKATSITLPLIILFLCYRHNQNRIKRVMIESLPFFTVSLAGFLLFKTIAQQSYIIRQKSLFMGAEHLWAKIAIAVQIPLFYLGKFLLPINLSVAYDTRFSPSLLSGAFFLSLIAGFVLIVAAVYFRTNCPEFLFCTVWYLATLIPVANLLSTHPIVADRYAYLPSFGFAFFLAAVLQTAGSRKSSGIGSILTVTIVILWAALATGRNRVWQSDKTLWEAAVMSSPRSEDANAHFGRICFIAGRYDEAFYHLGTAKELNPNNPEYDFFTGFLLFMRKDMDGAMKSFNLSLARNPGFVESLFFMGSVYETLGDKKSAAEYFRKAWQSPEPDVARLKPAAQEKLKQLL
jgi:tetratricopeptide (TPR) repeat protein